MKCDVIIPIGPGHETLAIEAMQSVAIAAMLSKGRFDEIQAVPFDDTSGRFGRSLARNLAVQQSDADWVYFLDADDYVLPPLFQSVELCLPDYDAVWGMYGEIEGIYLKERYQTWGFTTYKQLVSLGPHFTIKMGHFIRRDVALKYPFNTKMNAGEDWEYYFRVWASERCTKLGGPMVYAKRRGSHSKGPKSATGGNWNESVDAQFKLARKKLISD